VFAIPNHEEIPRNIPLREKNTPKNTPDKKNTPKNTPGLQNTQMGYLKYPKKYPMCKPGELAFPKNYARLFQKVSGHTGEKQLFVKIAKAILENIDFC